MRTLADYSSLLANLLPQGFAWPRKGITNRFSALLDVIAGELLQVESRYNSLVNELLPDTTNELIPEHERYAGLPESCTGPLSTLQERVGALVAKLSIQGGLSEQFYIDLAASMGYTITITVLSANNWQVNAPAATTVFFEAGISGAGDALSSSDNNLLECVITKYKPAHTAVTFNYV